MYVGICMYPWCAISPAVHQLTCGDDHACHVAPAEGELHLVRARVGVSGHVRARLQCEDFKILPEATQHRERKVFWCVLVADLTDTGHVAVLHVVINHNQQNMPLVKLKFETTLITPVCPHQLLYPTSLAK
jgi:hypothetical protein